MHYTPRMLDQARKLVRHPLLSVIGAGLLYAIALKYFVLPSRVILTGFEGIAVSLAYFFDRTWVFIVLYAIFQIALLWFAYGSFSKTFARRTLVVVVMVILGLALLPELQLASREPQNERLILVIFGGLLAGVAKALAFKNRGSTGDEDIIGAYFAMKHLRPVGSIIIIAAIVSTGFGLLMGLLKGDDFTALVNTLMYTCVYIFASAETLNNLYHKFKLTMLVVISADPERVKLALQEASPHRTYTIQTGVGGHTGNAFSMIRTIVTLEELPKLLSGLETRSPDAFYYHHEVEGVSRSYYITPIG